MTYMFIGEYFIWIIIQIIPKISLVKQLKRKAIFYLSWRYAHTKKSDWVKCRFFYQLIMVQKFCILTAYLIKVKNKNAAIDMEKQKYYRRYKIY